MAEVSIPQSGDVDPRTIVPFGSPTLHADEIRARRDEARARSMARTPQQVVLDAMRTESGLDEREKRSARLGVPETAMINWLRAAARQSDQAYAAHNLPELQAQAQAEAEAAGYVIHLAEDQQ